MFEAKFLGVDSLAFCAGHQQRFRVSTCERLKACDSRLRTQLSEFFIALELS